MFTWCGMVLGRLCRKHVWSWSLEIFTLQVTVESIEISHVNVNWHKTYPCMAGSINSSRKTDRQRDR